MSKTNLEVYSYSAKKGVLTFINFRIKSIEVKKVSNGAFAINCKEKQHDGMNWPAYAEFISFEPDGVLFSDFNGDWIKFLCSLDESNKVKRLYEN